MIDLHCHMLPGVDDGAVTEEEALLMAQVAVESGVTDVVLTPHCNVPEQFDNFNDRRLEQRFLQFEQLLRQSDVPLTPHRGGAAAVMGQWLAVDAGRQPVSAGGVRIW